MIKKLLLSSLLVFLLTSPVWAATETLYVNSYSGVRQEWTTRNPPSPYLANETTGYIHEASAASMEEGDFGFTNSGVGTGTINSVYLYFECQSDEGDEGFDVYLDTGSGFSNAGNVTATSVGTYAWETLNVSTALDSWAKIDAVTMYLDTTKIGNGSPTYVRRCYIYVDYATPRGITVEVGTGYSSSYSTSSTVIYNTTYEDARMQPLYFASDLAAAGIPPESAIIGAQLRCYQGSAEDLTDFRVRTQFTSSTTSSGWVTTGWTLNYGPTDVSTATGAWQNFSFGTPMYWNGTSNLLMDFTRDDTTKRSEGGMYLRYVASTRNTFYAQDGYTWPFNNLPYSTWTYVPALKITYAPPPTNDSLVFTNPDTNPVWDNLAVADDTTEWNFQAQVSHAEGYAVLDTVVLRLANASDNTSPYNALEFTWTEATDTFSETTDTQNCATITSTSTDSTCAGNTCTLNFKIRFNTNFSDFETDYNAELYSTTDDFSTDDEDSYSYVYRVTPTSSLFKAIQSTNPNDITAWGTAEVLDSAIAEYDAYGVISGIGSGDAYAVWINGTDIQGKKYTSGSGWDASATSIATGVTGLPYNMTVVSDDSGYMHLVYIDSSNNVIYRKYTTSWQTPVTLDSNTGNAYPSISIDASTGDLYAFWILSNHIYFKLGVSPHGSTDWDTDATDWQDTGINRWLTMSYKATSNQPPEPPTSLYCHEFDASSGDTNPVNVGSRVPIFSGLYNDASSMVFGVWTEGDVSLYKVNYGRFGGDVATAYELVLYDDEACTSLVFDSGKQSLVDCPEGTRSDNIPYTGPPLAFDGKTYWWKIKFWDNSDQEGAFSDCTDKFRILGPGDETRHGNYFYNRIIERWFTW